MERRLLNQSNQSQFSTIDLNNIFNKKYNEALIYQTIVAYQANARSSNRKQKDRADVHHSTKKPWRQKGTGRARAGMSSSPLWRGGGRIFPNMPNENFSQKINKKMYRAGLCSILSQLIRENRLLVVEDFCIDSLKTKNLLCKLKAMNLSSVLIVVEYLDKNLLLASRNLSNISVIKPNQANPLSLLFYKTVLFTKQAFVETERLLT